MTFPTLSPFFIPRPAPSLTSSALHRHKMVMVQHSPKEETEGPPLTAITSSSSSSSSSTTTRKRSASISSSSQLVSLVTGRWLKLICGASFEVIKRKTSVFHLLVIMTKNCLYTCRMWHMCGIYLWYTRWLEVRSSFFFQQPLSENLILSHHMINLTSCI